MSITHPELGQATQTNPAEIKNDPPTQEIPMLTEALLDEMDSTKLLDGSHEQLDGSNAFILIPSSAITESEIDKEPKALFRFWQKHPKIAAGTVSVTAAAVALTTVFMAKANSSSEAEQTGSQPVAEAPVVDKYGYPFGIENSVITDDIDAVPGMYFQAYTKYVNESYSGYNPNDPVILGRYEAMLNNIVSPDMPGTLRNDSVQLAMYYSRASKLANDIDGLNNEALQRDDIEYIPDIEGDVELVSTDAEGKRRVVATVSVDVSYVDPELKKRTNDVNSGSQYVGVWEEENVTLDNGSNTKRWVLVS